MGSNPIGRQGGLTPTARRGIFLLVVALIGSALIGGCAGGEKPQPPTPSLRESADPANVIHAALLSDGKTVKYVAQQLPADATTRVAFERDKPEPPKDQPRDKVHPRLQQMLAEGGPDKHAIIVVNFRDNLTMPRLPEPETKQGREAEINQRAAKRAEELIRCVAQRTAREGWASTSNSFTGIQPSQSDVPAIALSGA